jgi:tetratricopeptide (TPR) repeat protein
MKLITRHYRRLLFLRVCASSPLRVQPLIRHIRLCFFLVIFWLVLLMPQDGAAETKTLPAAVRVVLAKAGALIQDDQPKEAITLLEEFLRDRAGRDSGAPDILENAEIHFVLGTCHLVQGRYREATQSLERAVARDHVHLAAWLNLAKAAYELENYQRAAFSFDRAFALNHEAEPDHLYYSAVAFLLAGDYDASISRFERLLHDFAGHVTTTWRENYVHVLLAAERNHEALPTIKLLTEGYQGEKKIQWQEILLHQYLLLEMVDEARAYARLLTETAPNQAKWWKALAHILLQEGDYRQALAALVIRGYLEPLDQQERQLIADLYLQIGVPKQAAPLYRQLAAEKDDRRTLLNLVIALRQIDADEEALALLERITTIAEDAQLVAHKADLLYGLKRFQEAAALYQRLAHLDKDRAKHALQMHEYALLQAEASSGLHPKQGKPAHHNSGG